MTALALGDGGAVIAAAENDGRIVALYDGATGAAIRELAAGDQVRRVTALAFGDRALYAGTSTGLVLELALARRR